MLSRRVSQSDKVNRLSAKAQIVWTWTLPWLDDYGCYTGNAEDIKSEVFPRNPKISKKDIEAALFEQANIGTIILYKTEGKIYQQYQNYEKSPNGDVFQTFKNDRERESAYPQYQQGFEIIGNLGIPADSNGVLNISKVKLSKEEDNIPSVGFDSFWKAYPNKVGKGKCEEWWVKHKPDAALLAKMLSAVENQKTWEQWRKNNGQFIPMPATWLNQKRWDDTGVDRPKQTTQKAVCCKCGKPAQMTVGRASYCGGGCYAG
jgi:hypothetical protein